MELEAAGARSPTLEQEQLLALAAGLPGPDHPMEGAEVAGACAQWLLPVTAAETDSQAVPETQSPALQRRESAAWDPMMKTLMQR